VIIVGGIAARCKRAGGAFREAVMPRCGRGLGWVGLVAGCLVLAGPARAIYPPGVKDEGKFFTKEGLEKADKKVREIYAKYRKDVVVETYMSPPEGKALPEDREKRAEFYREWAEKRIKELGVNGVYILVTRKPPHLHMEVDELTRKKAFTQSDRNKAAKKMLAEFKDKKFDAGLMSALESIEESLKANLSK
jgi:hypothetical protein